MKRFRTPGAAHRTDCRSLTQTTDTQPAEPLHAPIPLSPSQVDSAPPRHTASGKHRRRVAMPRFRVREAAE
jgi:hypothetical protein